MRKCKHCNSPVSTSEYGFMPAHKSPIFGKVHICCFCMKELEDVQEGEKETKKYLSGILKELDDHTR